MKATEKKIREIAAFLIYAQTVNGIVETMNRIAVSMDGYSDDTVNYFRGLYEFIDNNDRTFQTLTDDEKFHVQNIGARLLLGRENIVTAFVRLHHLLDWLDGEDIMWKLADKLDRIAEKGGYPTVKYDE